MSTPNPVPASPQRFAAGPFTALVERLRSWFGAGAPALPFDHAVAALLVHAASLRGPMSPARRARIQALLRNYLGGGDAEIAALLSAARSEDDRAVDLHHFARVVNHHLPQEGRLAVLDMSAQVAFADRAGADEEGFLRLLGGLLGVSDHDRGIVQHRARSPFQPAQQTSTP